MDRLDCGLAIGRRPVDSAHVAIHVARVAQRGAAVWVGARVRERADAMGRQMALKCILLPKAPWTLWARQRLDAQVRIQVGLHVGSVIARLFANRAGIAAVGARVAARGLPDDDMGLAEDRLLGNGRCHGGRSVYVCMRAGGGGVVVRVKNRNNESGAPVFRIA